MDNKQIELINNPNTKNKFLLDFFIENELKTFALDYFLLPKTFYQSKEHIDKSKFLDGFTQEYLLSNTYKHKGEVEKR